ncbi:hypothetical protein ACWGI8_44565 [Streptomyces sp. NPDC054841]
MRALASRPITTTALSLALLLGAAGPAMAVQEEAPRAVAAEDTADAPVPGAETVLAQVTVLDKFGGVVVPVTDLLKAVLAADNGRLAAADATKHADAIKAAIAEARAAAADPATAPSVPSTQTPQTPAAPKPQAPQQPEVSVLAAMARADVVEEALTALQERADALITAATSGDAAAVAEAQTAVVEAVVNFIAATLVGEGLPEANLDGLPALPEPTPSQENAQSVAPALPES